MRIKQKVTSVWVGSEYDGGFVHVEDLVTVGGFASFSSVLCPSGMGAPFIGHRASGEELIRCSGLIGYQEDKASLEF